MDRVRGERRLVRFRLLFETKLFLGEHSDPFLHSYLRVPGQISGRTSPSVASMTSEPESCIDDTRYMDNDDDIDIGRFLHVTFWEYSVNEQLFIPFSLF